MLVELFGAQERIYHEKAGQRPVHVAIAHHFEQVRSQGFSTYFMGLRYFLISQSLGLFDLRYLLLSASVF